MSTKRQLGRAAAIAATASVAAMLTAGVASAHVSANVYGEPAEQGGYTAITMRVPNESETAGTDKVTVHFDPEYQIARVRTKPVPGWTAKVTMAKLDKPVTTDDGAELTEVVSAVTWTAAKGGGIPAGEASYEEFSFSTGPLPEVEHLMLPADQHYTDGKTVKWDQEGEESERPAPVVELAPSSGGHHGGGDKQASADAEEGGHSDEAAGESAPVDTTARWLGGIGLVVGALGVGFGAGAILRGRKKAGQS